VVGYDEINGMGTEELQGFIYAGSAEDGVSGVLQDELAEVKPGTFIINGENYRHRLPPLPFVLVIFKSDACASQEHFSGGSKGEKRFIDSLPQNAMKISNPAESY
jgi:hypothetical protein